MTKTHILLSSIAVSILALAAAAEGAAQAHTIRVPSQQPTIQAAVDAAEDGDIIKVAAGRYCGAVIDREVHLVASWATSIKGCVSAGDLGALHVGFLLADERASGSSIRGFRFDGAGISDTNLEPVALAIVGRDAHGVRVEGNWIEGTVQGVTNTSGEGWIVAGNFVHDLSLLTCVAGGRCGGGVGIVFQQRDPDAERAFGNVAVLNFVSGRIPDGHEAFDMAGIFVLGQELPVLSLNRLEIPHNPAAPAEGNGIHVSDVCCGDPTGLLTTRHAVIIGNDGRHSEVAVRIDLDADGGSGNSATAFLHGNRGVIMIDGIVVASAAAKLSGIPAGAALAASTGLATSRQSSPLF